VLLPHRLQEPASFSKGGISSRRLQGNAREDFRSTAAIERLGGFKEPVVGATQALKTFFTYWRLRRRFFRGRTAGGESRLATKEAVSLLEVLGCRRGYAQTDRDVFSSEKPFAGLLPKPAGDRGRAARKEAFAGNVETGGRDHYRGTGP